MRKSCVIVDDSINCIKDLSYEIEELDLIDIERTFSDPDLFLVKLDSITSDIIFLDIEMPISGIKVAEKIKNKNVVFVSGTSNIQYALDAFKIVKSTDFLRKPVVKSELKETIERILNASKDFVIVNSEKYAKHKIKLDDIAYIETIPNNNNYKSIQFINQKQNQLLVKERDSLSAWIEKNKLPNNFLKLGASIVINMNAIIALNGRAGSRTPELVIELQDGSICSNFSISTEDELSILLDYRREFKSTM